MLVKLKCSEFRNGKKQRPTIVFNKGLNVVTGRLGSSGSVGKSTFLMAIDFVFGGDDYMGKMAEIVHIHVPKHEFYFTFEFSGEQFHFSRATIESENVYVCNDNYERVQGEPWSIRKFRDWIYEQYALPDDNPLARGHISQFFRIYHRRNTNEKNPLNYPGKNTAEAIDSLLQLLGEPSIAYEKSALNKSKRKLKVYNDATTFDFIPGGATEEDVMRNKSEIRNIQQKIDDLINRDPAQLEALNIAHDNERALATLRNKLFFARQSRGNIESEIAVIKRNIEARRDDHFVDAFNELLEFFPGANIPLLNKIEEFHTKLATMLQDEFGTALEKLQESLAIINDEIREIEAEITELGKKDRAAELFAQAYYALKNDMSRLQRENDTFKLLIDLKNAVDAQAKRLEILEAQKRDVLLRSGQRITDKMWKINEIICGDKLSAPSFKLNSLAKCSFNTFQDGGTSASYRGLAVFDLAVLALTNLPVIAHDFVILSQIEGAHREKIFDYYAQLEGKQVFVALDEIETYSDKAKSLLEKSTVLMLTGDEDDVLYGKSWNTKIEQETVQMTLEDVSVSDEDNSDFDQENGG